MNIAFYRIAYVSVSSCCLMLLSGCSEPQREPAGSTVRQLKTRSRYPTGIDTVAAWSEGRFQICVDSLYDEEAKPDPCILRLVRAYFEEGALVYIRAKNACVVLNVENKNIEKFSVTQIPERYQMVFERLQNETKDKRVHLLPIINP
jgi:hypothetical protein